MNRHPQPSAGTLRLLLAIAFAVAAFNLFRYRTYVLDDTFISLRYARNLVDGHGLVFNPGERVEGYTNFLFVLVAALFLRLGVEPIVALKACGVVAALTILWLMARIERGAVAAHQRQREPAISVILLAPLQAFAYWTLCPMETIWFTALLLLAVYLSAPGREPPRLMGATLVFVLLSLTRPEGVFLWAVWVVILAAFAYGRSRQLDSLFRFIPGAVTFAVVLGGYSVWRHAYYGSWVPNTFYAKVTGQGQLSSGLSYVGLWLAAFPLLAAALILFPAPLRVFRATRPWAVIAMYGLVVAYGAYVVAIGGDFMPFFRFLLPAMPLLCLLLAWMLRTLLIGRGAMQSLVLAAVCLVHVVCSLFTEQTYRAFVADRTAVVGERVGEWFRDHLSADDVIAVNTAGSLPYYSQLPTIDMLGLTDAQIAHRPIYIVSPNWAGHRRGWGEYVLNRRPRAILWYNSAGAREPYYLGDHELADSPFFRFFYQPKTVTLPQPDGASPPIERFLGFPFGYADSGRLTAADLGVRMEFRRSPLPMTSLYEEAIALNYFEFDARDTGLWQLKGETGAGVDTFVDAVSQRWRGAVDRSGDPEARARVEALAADAYHLIQAQDYRGARQVLGVAARQNETAKSPLVYQYIANLGVLTGDLFLAINAQKEAFRLAPENALYRGNLKRLLTIPYKEGTPPRFD